MSRAMSESFCDIWSMLMVIPTFQHLLVASSYAGPHPGQNLICQGLSDAPLPMASLISCRLIRGGPYQRWAAVAPALSWELYCRNPAFPAKAGACP